MKRADDDINVARTWLAGVPIEGRVDWGLTVSPDRRTFLHELAGESGSDLMLVENFR